MDSDRYLELICPACEHRTVVGPTQMIAQLRAAGLLKWQKEPDLLLVRELFVTRIEQLACDACQHLGLRCQPWEDWDDENWDASRSCEVCHRAIARERLEVFPDTRRCRDCQHSAERGEDAAEPEFCPRCGAIMELRLQRGSGLTRYVMSCRGCGK